MTKKYYVREIEAAKGALKAESNTMSQEEIEELKTYIEDLKLMFKIKFKEDYRDKDNYEENHKEVEYKMEPTQENLDEDLEEEDFEDKWEEDDLPCPNCTAEILNTLVLGQEFSPNVVHWLEGAMFNIEVKDYLYGVIDCYNDLKSRIK